MTNRPAYYNEFDPFAAAWLRNLIDAGLIPAGAVDERSILDVRPGDLAGYGQCHFFAGIGGWPLALRLAGWPDDRPVWTGSCPCQPFSSAGKRKGTDDERHLWPAWLRLIGECKPPRIYGEQVSSSEVVGHEGEGSRIPAYLSEAEPRSRFGATCAVSGSQAKGRFRPYEPPSGPSGQDRRWGMRDQRPSVQLGWWQDLGQSVVGSDRPENGVRLPEHTRSPARGEQRYGGLGGCKDAAHRPFDPQQAARSLQRALRQARQELDEIAGGAWIDLVRSDLEEVGYAVGASDTPAAGVGAPHIRQRLFWVADAVREGSFSGTQPGVRGGQEGAGSRHGEPQRRVVADRLEHADSPGRHAGKPATAPARHGGAVGPDGGTLGLENAEHRGCQAGVAERRRAGPVLPSGPVGGVADPFDGSVSEPQRGSHRRVGTIEAGRLDDRGWTGAHHGGWGAADWLFCTDGKWRPVEPGAFPLAHGVPGRVGLLRAYGNAINPQVAAVFIQAVMEARR